MVGFLLILVDGNEKLRTILDSAIIVVWPVFKIKFYITLSNKIVMIIKLALHKRRIVWFVHLRQCRCCCCCCFVFILVFVSIIKKKTTITITIFRTHFIAYPFGCKRKIFLQLHVVVIVDADADTFNCVYMLTAKRNWSKRLCMYRARLYTIHTQRNKEKTCSYTFNTSKENQIWSLVYATSNVM